MIRFWWPWPYFQGNYIIKTKIEPCVHSISWINRWNLTKLAQIHQWDWGWMDGWIRVLRPFNSISVISRRWKGEHERLCAMKRRLGSRRMSPPAGFEPATPWTEVGSANRSATQTLLMGLGKEVIGFWWPLSRFQGHTGTLKLKFW